MITEKGEWITRRREVTKREETGTGQEEDGTETREDRRRLEEIELSAPRMAPFSEILWRTKERRRVSGGATGCHNGRRGQ